MVRTALRTSLAFLALAAVACERAPGSDAERLDLAYRSAAEEYAVPQPLLEAIGFSETRWWMRPGVASIDQGYGVMHLVDRGAQGPLATAARLTGQAPDELKTDLDANVRGAAAVLRAYADRYFRDTPSKDERRLSDWWQVVMRYSGWEDAAAADDFATQVFQLVGRGARGVLPDGSVHSFGAHPVEVSDEKLFGRMPSPLTPDYATAHWVAAAPSNFSSDSRPPTIDLVVIHTMQGSYSGSINWFKNPSSKASAHYMVRSSDGDVTQMVEDKDIAWHAGNWDVNSRSIGIEHEGYVDQPSWFTEPMYQASANLTRWICDTYHVPKDRQHVIGHYEVPSDNPACHPQQGGHSCHTDPCVKLDGSQCFWNWTHYMNLIGGQNPAPTTGTLKGFVFSSEGGAVPANNTHPITGARVFIPETGDTKLSDGHGYWEFELAPGDYKPSASSPGFIDGSPVLGATRHVAAGTATYGSFVLTKISTAGTVKGVVYAVNPADASDKSSRVDGALVSIGTNVVSAGADGAWQLGGVPAGLVTVTVTKDGYNSGSGDVDVSSGQTATLDIGLLPSDSQPPRVTFTHPADGAVVGDTPVTVEGTVDDPTATLKVNGVVVAVQNGKFTTAVALLPAENLVKAEAVDPGGNAGRAQLRLVYDPKRTGLTGKVVDALTAAPVKEAVVSAGEAFSKTGADGLYALDLAAGDVSVSVQAAGYVARTLTATVKDGMRTNQDIFIVPSSAGALIGITAPANNATVTTSTVEVTGVSHIPALAALKVNDVVATVEADGTFKATIALTAGENTIVARGRGQDGIEASAQIKVTYSALAPAVSGCHCAGGFDVSMAAMAGLGALLRRRRTARAA